MSLSIDDGSRSDHVPEISTPKGEETILANIVRAMNGQQEVLLNLCRNISETRTPLSMHSSPIPRQPSEADSRCRKSRKMATLVLEDPVTINMEIRRQDYVTMTCVLQLEEIRDVALSHEWSILSSAGRLGITISKDIDTAVEKLRAYIRAPRNPLLDRLFHCDQGEGESIVICSVRCRSHTHRLDVPIRQPHCTRCHRPCGHGAALTQNQRSTHLRACRQRDTTARSRRISVSDRSWRELLQSVNLWSFLKRQRCDWQGKSFKFPSTQFASRKWSTS